MSQNLNDLSEEAITTLVMGGEVPIDEPRSLLDVFTEEEILSLPAHPRFHFFTIAFQDWVYRTIDGITCARLIALGQGH
jgi:hypothetical protein